MAGAFLRPLAASWATSTVTRGDLRGPRVAEVTTGTLVKYTTSCKEASCPGYLTLALKDILRHSVDVVCPTPTFVAGTLESNIEIHLFFTKKAGSEETYAF